jgi:hypothetical protein
MSSRAFLITAPAKASALVCDRKEIHLESNTDVPLLGRVPTGVPFLISGLRKLAAYAGRSKAPGFYDQTSGGGLS